MTSRDNWTTPHRPTPRSVGADAVTQPSFLIGRRIQILLPLILCSVVLWRAGSVQAQAGGPPTTAPELRGTWLTTTGNDAIATPRKTADTMKRLRKIGINTVYVECWKNGYTQYPSQVLNRTIGVDRRPNLMPQDPSDTPENLKKPARDLLQETLIEAHRNGLIYIAWFEYGFMAAHKDTDNHLRRMKKEWLSRDIDGNEVAPNGFVWMNPLHPDARRFLLDIVLEAVDKYDLDGIQLDDRIVWPHVTMGYDDYTKKVYAQEHDGRSPPADHKDPAWIRWRADKINEYAHQFVSEVRARRPGLVISLSPAVYPWVYDNYCLEWPKWAATDWNVMIADLNPIVGDPDATSGPAVPVASVAGWDEFVPQNYRFSYDAFETTWLDQIRHWREFAGGRSTRGLIPGIRIVGDGKDSTWDQLRQSIELARKSGNGGHVLWFSKGVLDLYPEELTKFYDVKNKGFAPNPHFPADWRPAPVSLANDGQFKGGDVWKLHSDPPPAGAYSAWGRFRDDWRIIALSDDQQRWLKGERAAADQNFRVSSPWISSGKRVVPSPTVEQSTGFEEFSFDAVELLRDRRTEMAAPRATDLRGN